MKFIKNFKDRSKGLIDSVIRYPLTTAFLTAAAIIMIIAIHNDKDYSKWQFIFFTGAVLGIAAQAAYERFFDKLYARLLLYGCAAAFTFVYYLTVKSAAEINMEISVKTSVIIAALIIAYIWIPAIKSKLKFEESFMAVFKSFFLTLLYMGILMGGCTLIIAAVDTLIYNIDPNVYGYAADIIFVLFAPVFFLSLIPIYPGKYLEGTDNESKAATDRAISCPKFLDVLFSYIIIPLISIYSLILLIYIAMNIGKDFWSNNLLEPMLIAYAVAVIFTYIITSRLENKAVALFRKIFPKALIVIVLFQTVSTIANLNDTGITAGRYYVILFGVFAAASGAVMCLKERRNGIIAMMFVLFCAISVIPPIDAFGVSRASQIDRLEAVLIKNDMLKNNEIKSNDAISDEDKNIIIQSVQYLVMTDDIDEAELFDENFDIGDFYNTFGFNQYDTQENEQQYISVYLNQNTPVNIEGYDILINTYINGKDEDGGEISAIDYLDESYSLVKEKLSDKYDIVLLDKNKNEIIRFETDKIFSKYKNFNDSTEGISEEDATFIVENKKAKMKVVIKNAGIDMQLKDIDNNADFYVLIKFK